MSKYHPHFKQRAEWVVTFKGQRVLDIGCGLGEVVAELRNRNIEAWGVDINNQAIEDSYAWPYCWNRAIADINVDSDDFLVSWNLLDCLNEYNIKQSYDVINKANISFHALCVDDGGRNAENYKEQGYFIKPIEYWLELLPNAVLVEYHSGKVHRAKNLKMPLSWGKISN